MEGQRDALAAAARARGDAAAARPVLPRAARRAENGDHLDDRDNEQYHGARVRRPQETELQRVPAVRAGARQKQTLKQQGVTPPMTCS